MIDLKEARFELLVALLGFSHEHAKFRLSPNVIQKRIVLVVGIGEKAALNVSMEHQHCRSLIAQHGIGLRNFIRCQRESLGLKSGCSLK